MNAPLVLAVVGHTNAGKTSLLRTLTRRVDFGEVSDRPGTTRHSEAIALKADGRLLARFIDTPGLEDSVALLEFLQRQPGQTRLARVRAFLAGPEAQARFEQEAKVLRALLDGADCALLVIDAREPVLPKYRAEIEILSWCARPVMPLLNFVGEAGASARHWHAALQECGLHARAEFDVVAPLDGSEQQLYTDLATLLPAQRAQLHALAAALARGAREREQAALRSIAEALVEVAAMRRSVSAADYADAAERAAVVQRFQGEVRGHARRAAAALLALHAFRPGDAELAELPDLSGRWEDDLFNPLLLREAGRQLGFGAAIGASVGLVADLALAGLSLGVATTLGATVGSIVSGGGKPLFEKLKNRLQGVHEMSVEDPVLLLLARRLLQLARALAQRGHGAVQALQLADEADAEPLSGSGARELLRLLAPARAHARWEEGQGAGDGEERERTVRAVADWLQRQQGRAVPRP
ncbi:GTPase/DUF3482 domain-containing protein [Comamonas sp. NLF-1-9]|uniref:GTPase/DUF3482 domain-containing protein n=1 Tax=Comamonas sp. NLF-1-9 TaxID=2853163 RepID=UPI001C48C8E0|nr:GTPase/DUF3482 domain-containing protein [Comamonas sp. NLF-1-9]QXL84170.1 GTPase/DUF3482 domain-containing protein [Comamonas sp. NLF-1-9]